jgi:hypothetical protein
MPELAPVAWFTESIIDKKEFVSAVFACESAYAEARTQHSLNRFVSEWRLARPQRLVSRPA